MPSQVKCGTSATPFSNHYVGHTVGELRESLRDELNIPDGAEALITRSGETTGRRVPDSDELPNGCTLEFVRTSGRKGISRLRRIIKFFLGR